MNYYWNKFNLVKWLIYLALFLIIYGLSFYLLGNTLYRADSSGKKIFSLSPLFTEGFVGPLRSLYIMASTGNFYGFVHLLVVFITNFWSPYGVILFLYIVDFNLTNLT